MPATATPANPHKGSVSKLPDRIALSTACKKLGVSRQSFRKHWHKAFTPYETDGGHHLVSEDELFEALRYTKPTDARAAVMMLRQTLGRL